MVDLIVGKKITFFLVSVGFKKPFICCVNEESFNNDFLEFFGWKPILAQILKQILHSFDKLVLVIACLGGQFGINCPSVFLKIWNCLSKMRAIWKFSKITSVIYTKNRLKQTCDYWLITPNLETLCIETNIF